MATGNSGLLDGIRRIGGAFRDIAIGGGLPGAPYGFRLRGATPAGPPTSGTWKTRDLVPDGLGQLWTCTAGGTPGTWTRLRADPSSNFYIEDFGGVANGVVVSDAAITSGQNTVTTAGVANPSTAPTLTPATTGGTVAAGTYQVAYTFTTPFGETTASSAQSVTTTTGASTIAVTAPAVNGVPGGATGVNYYITANGGSTFFKQVSNWPFQQNYTQYSAPVTTTVQPPSANTTTSSPFYPQCVGQSIRIVGAGAAGADLLTTITGHLGPQSVTVLANASTTVTRSGCAFGTDNSIPIQLCVNAVAAYADQAAVVQASAIAFTQAAWMAASNSVGEVIGRNGIYLMATSPTVGGSYNGNCVIQLPAVANGQAKQRIIIRGVSRDAATLPVYQQMTPEVSGTCFMYIGAAGTNNTTYGPSSVFGTPCNTVIYGGESGTVPGTINIRATFDSVRIVVPWAAGISGVDLFSAAQGAIYNCSAQALAIAPSGGSWTQLAANGPVVNQWGWGFRMPAGGNNCFCYAQQVGVEGFCYGFGASELTVADYVTVVYCLTGIEAFAGGGVTMVHSGYIGYATVQYCTNGVGAFDGIVRLDIGQLNLESVNTWVYDPLDKLIGTIGVWVQGSPNFYATSVSQHTNLGSASQCTVLNKNTAPGPVASPGGTISSGSAWFNGYFTPVQVSFTATTSITSITVTGTNGVTITIGTPSGATTWTFTIGPGWSYTPTYTGSGSHAVAIVRGYLWRSSSTSPVPRCSTRRARTSTTRRARLSSRRRRRDRGGGCTRFSLSPARSMTRTGRGRRWTARSARSRW